VVSPDTSAADGIVPAQPACAGDAGSWCAWIYQLTSNDFLSRSADELISTTLQITLIVAIALLARFLIHRAISRLVEGAANTRIPRLGRRRTRTTSDGVPMTPRRAQRARTMGSVLRSASSAIILLIASIMILAEFGVNLGPILASAGIVGVAVGFGAQNLVRDFLSGMFMLLEDQYGVGDTIDVGPVSGDVEAVGLRITTIRDGNGTIWYVRNGEILRVGNKSQGYATATVDLPLAHSADIAEATAIAERVADELVTRSDIAEVVLEEPEVLGVERIGPEGITFRVTVKTKPNKQFAVQRALIAALTDAFDDAGVPRPTLFPGLPTKGPSAT
jgi:small-conductance mechanosensitive channel